MECRVLVGELGNPEGVLLQGPPVEHLINLIAKYFIIHQTKVILKRIQQGGPLLLAQLNPIHQQHLGELIPGHFILSQIIKVYKELGYPYFLGNAEGLDVLHYLPKSPPLGILWALVSGPPPPLILAGLGLFAILLSPRDRAPLAFNLRFLGLVLLNQKINLFQKFVVIQIDFLIPIHVISGKEQQIIF